MSIQMKWWLTVSSDSGNQRQRQAGDDKLALHGCSTGRKRTKVDPLWFVMRWFHRPPGRLCALPFSNDAHVLLLVVLLDAALAQRTVGMHPLEQCETPTVTLHLLFLTLHFAFLLYVLFYRSLVRKFVASNWSHNSVNALYIFAQ